MEKEDDRYRLTFETMEEEMVNNASSKAKVRRNTKGNVLSTENISVAKTMKDAIS